MWTTGGYAQNLVRRHLLEVAAELTRVEREMKKTGLTPLPGILEAHKDKLKLSFLTLQKRDDANAGFLGIAISCPVKMPVYSGHVEKLMSRWEKWLGLPYSRWNLGKSKSKVRGCVMLYLFFGMQASHLDGADEAAQQ
jgi:hypothetical protein